MTEILLKVALNTINQTPFNPQLLNQLKENNQTYT